MDSSKGQVQNLMQVVAAFFGIAILIVIISGAFNDINNVWQDTDAFSNTSKNMVRENTNEFTTLWDWGFVFLFLGSIIAGIVGLFQLQSHPVIFTVSILALIIIFLITGMLANSYDDIAQTGEFDNWLDKFTFVPLVMQYYLESIIVTASLFVLALFAKSQSPGGRL